MKHKSLTLIAASAILGGATIFGTVLAADISGAGATFPYPIYAKWADAYKKAAGVGLNYQSIGSGAGIKQIQAKTVTFGATDAPLKGEQLDKDGLIQFPMVMGGVVPVVNINGIKPGELVLDGDTALRAMEIMHEWSKEESEAHRARAEAEERSEIYGAALARLFSAVLAEGGDVLAHRVVRRLRRDGGSVDLLDLPPLQDALRWHWEWINSPDGHGYGYETTG